MKRRPWPHYGRYDLPGCMMFVHGGDVLRHVWITRYIVLTRGMRDNSMTAVREGRYITKDLKRVRESSKEAIRMEAAWRRWLPMLA